MTRLMGPLAWRDGVFTLYGSGLRLLESCRLRVWDRDFGMNQIVVRDGKARAVAQAAHHDI